MLKQTLNHVSSKSFIVYMEIHVRGQCFTITDNPIETLIITTHQTFYFHIEELYWPWTIINQHHTGISGQQEKYFRYKNKKMKIKL